MAQLCLNFVFRLFRGGKNVYVAVCSESIAEGGCPRPHHARGRREFKHKPICERVFCSVSFTLVLEFLPERQVFCSSHTSLCVH